MAGTLPIRRVKLDLSDIPVDWAGTQQMTHVLNGMFALFPDGEMYFCRSVRRFAGQASVSDAVLKGFYGQEANHGAAHREAFEMLEAQGYEIESWLSWYRYQAYERQIFAKESVMHLAVTAALEHLTATLADIAFDPNDIVAGVHPTLRELVQWHAAEEIEHRSVAFDVFQEVDGRWALRVAGMGLALFSFIRFGASAAHHLAKQDGTRGVRSRFAMEVLRRPRVLAKVLRYCAPGFHPDETGPHVAAEAFLAAM